MVELIVWINCVLWLNFNFTGKMFQKNIGKLATITGKGASIDKSYKKAGDGALKLDNPLLEADKNGRAGDSAYLTIEGEDGDNLLRRFLSGIRRWIIKLLGHFQLRKIMRRMNIRRNII